MAQIYKNSLSDIQLNENQKYWLTEVQQLSKTLRVKFESWNMSLYYSGRIEAESPEKKMIDCVSGQDFYGRLISHNISEEPVIIGKVIMSLDTYDIYKHILENMHSESIGENLLFKIQMQRSRLKVKREYSDGITCFKYLPEHIYLNLPKQVLSRSSVFIKDENKILVIEYFLRDIEISKC